MAVLEITDVKKTYRSPTGERQTIIDIPKFAMEEKAHVALEGRSGSGKTTFLNLIAGILKADTGQLLVEGTDIQSLSEPSRDLFRAKTIGYVHQTFNLLQGYTALENVELGMMFGRGLDKEYAVDLLGRVGLGDRIHYYPGQLSVGQQQRVAVARAMANHPKLVLADEPTGNLDPHHTHEALSLIRGICREQGTALLLVSHDDEVLQEFENRQSLAAINLAGQEASTA
ncbi:MAG: ABC transporter ATP-binding protein [Candidatus Omnitrophica bacterium]|nr:ABC transporter ATP-binding protein [Candidatus Omnitrophota bacterium]MCA9443407.1 ABC transporter ATP-binding protein [Candidatus Omnitrophota bacterium]